MKRDLGKDLYLGSGKRTKNDEATRCIMEAIADNDRSSTEAGPPSTSQPTQRSSIKAGPPSTSQPTHRSSTKPGPPSTLQPTHRSSTKAGPPSTSQPTTRSSTEAGPSSTSQPKHKIFLSHSGAQKYFVENLCKDLEDHHRFPFFDKRESSLPKAERFPERIFEAAQQCNLAVVVVSEEYFTSKWPMIELVEFVRAKKSGRNPNLKILPLFMGLSVSEFSDQTRQEGWFRMWAEWAEEDSLRINVPEWKEALKEVKAFNGMQFHQDMRKLASYQKNVVRMICKLVTPDMKWYDSHVHGGSNICKVYREQIGGIQPSGRYKVRVIGYYGVGGLGKTTMCKVLCNELALEFEDKVCHVEMAPEPSSLQKLLHLQEVLRRLTRTREEDLCGLNEGEEAAFPERSVVMVTARTLRTLRYLGIDESQCFEVPELSEEDARNLFLYHAANGREYVAKGDIDMIDECVSRCYFRKSENQGCHYLPLAVKVLGMHMGSMGSDPKQWLKSLPRIRDFDLHSPEENPVFGVIRLNYDRLTSEEQALFMDIVCYCPGFDDDDDDNSHFMEWLGIVHQKKWEEIGVQLQRLKDKGLLEDVDVSSGEFSLHDLHREFAELEVQGKLKGGKFHSRRFVYAYSHPFELEKKPSGGVWENLVRVGIEDEDRGDEDKDGGILRFQRIQWRYCSNVVVLKLDGLVSLKGVLKLKGLWCLRSLELRELCALGGVEGLKDLENLTYFQWVLPGIYKFTRTFYPHLGQLPGSLKVLRVEGVGATVGRDVFARCTNLCSLKLWGIRADDGIDFTQCSSLLTLDLWRIEGLQELTGHRTECLQSLRIYLCNELRDASGFEHSVGLREMFLGEAQYDWLNNALEKVPDLQKLTGLQILKIEYCTKISEVRGLDSLRQLRELECRDLGNLSELPSLSGLQHLHHLILSGCSKLTGLEGVGDLPLLRHLVLDGCTSLVRLPELSKCTNLEKLVLDGCTSLVRLPELSKCTNLEKLDLSFCCSLVRLPELSKCTNLEELRIAGTGMELGEEDIVMLSKLPKLRPVLIAFDAVWYIKLDVVKRRVLKDVSEETSTMHLNLEGPGATERDLETPPIKLRDYKF